MAHITYPEINYQEIIYYAAPRKKTGRQSWMKWDPEFAQNLRQTGHFPRRAEKAYGVAVDCSDRQRIRENHLPGNPEKHGIILLFLYRSDQEHPEL